MKKPEFNSIEEVKEFIKNASADNSVGVVAFVDENGETQQITIKEFVEKVGLDKAAEFFYETKQTKLLGMNKNEIQELINKFNDDPESLTQEEKTFLFFLLDKIGPEKDIINEILSIMIASLILGDGFTKNYSGLLIILLNLIEKTFLLSSNLSVHVNNEATYNEILRNVKSKIIIPDDIDEESLFLGLIDIIGERFINSNLTKNMEVNYKEFIKSFDLDEELIFNKKSLDNKKEMKNVVDKYKKQLMPEVKDFLALTQNSKSNTKDVKLDIRKTLKNNKKY